jgi:hypothetical protein
LTRLTAPGVGERDCLANPSRSNAASDGLKFNF